MIAVCLFGLFQLSTSLKCSVHTKCGFIEGTVLQYNGISIPAFLGIPYAKPPIGNLRFLKTVPVTTWSGRLQATHVRPACLQHHPPDLPWVDNSTLQSEDCLYLNVYVPPNPCKCSKKAVLFWIHGGGFAYGSGTMPLYDGRVLASEGDVVVVTTNYRLGILGFASTEDAPGNMGLNDVLVALRWVKENIAGFGGDPDNVTIFGQSAGSVIVGLLCVSEKAKGLFKKSIMQSGSAARNGIDSRKTNNELIQKVAKSIGCPPVGIIQCLRNINARELVEFAYELHADGFSVVVGDDILKIDPQTAIKIGLFNDVDIMVGNTQDDGSYKLADGFPETFGYFGEKNPNVNKTSGKSYIRKLFKDLHPGDKDVVIQRYLGNLTEFDYEAVRSQTYHSIGDYSLICPVIYLGESFAKKGNAVYAYYFNHIPSVTPWAKWMGSVHTDEIAFVFGRPLDHPHLYTAAEVNLSRTFIRAWTNFAKYGFPGRNWKKFSRSKPYFKVFKISNRENLLEYHKKNCEFFRPFLGFR